MKLVFRNALAPFAIITTFISGVAVLFMAYNFWQRGLLNPDSASTIYESTQVMESISNGKLVDSVINLVESDNAREAIVELENFEKKFIELNRHYQSAEADRLKDQVTEFKTTIKQLIAVPEFKNITQVISNKMGEFSNFVAENRWPTLMRISQRVMLKLNPTNFKSNRSYSQSKVSSFVSSLKADVTNMVSVTNGSVLPERDKSSIVTRLVGFNKEIEMMETYLSSLSSVNAKTKAFNESYSQWLKSIEPQLSLRKIQMEKDSEYFVYSIVAFAFVMFALSVISIWLSKYDQRKTQKNLESLSMMLIKEGLLPYDMKLPYKMSDSFMNELSKHREYIHKRMSFGAIFQDALPFSALLLDSNLNMVWANQLFFENWSIDQLQREKVWSWDFLQQKTNLGEVDPVMMALKENIAGIYQIQVQHAENETLPYEMYVSPVEYAEQKRIMIFFYPLRSVEETLANQTRAIVGPVSRALDSLVQDGFDREFQEKIQKDFYIAGIEDVHQKFIQVNSLHHQQKNSLLAEIERLENNLYDEHKLVDDLNEKLVALKTQNVEIVSAFENLKNHFMAYVQTRFEWDDLEQVGKRHFADLEKGTNNLYSIASRSNEILEENVKALHNVRLMREEFHKLRDEIENYRFQVIQTLEQTLVFCRKEGLDASLEGAFGKIKMEIKGFERILNQLNHSIRGLDVTFSKIEMIGQTSTGVKLDDVKDGQLKLVQGYEDNQYHIGRLVRQAEKTEEMIVKNLKEMYDHFQVLRRNVQWGMELIADRRQIEEHQDSSLMNMVDEPVKTNIGQLDA